MVVDHLHAAFSNHKDIGIAWIYLNHKEVDNQTPARLLAGLWRQLVLDRDIHYVQPPPGQSFGQLIQSMARSSQLCGGLPSRPERPFVAGYTDCYAQLCLALSSSSGAMSGCVQAVFRHL
ncbi:hypothetical protein K438DRAFT_1823173 [Mycena galopus ATCC 62051]|nr:hypothetical protein K438DRAFT_1888813 [Mycena galopus ATCC 62051]KAF8200075.1 hypothetical protein K438DRAFT_1823173 [Mycena galopus ATCC 62051]